MCRASKNSLTFPFFTAHCVVRPPQLRCCYLTDFIDEKIFPGKTRIFRPWNYPKSFMSICLCSIPPLTLFPMNIYFMTSHFRNDATTQIARTCFLSKVSKLERLCSMLRTFKRLEFLDRWLQYLVLQTKIKCA